MRCLLGSKAPKISSQGIHLHCEHLPLRTLRSRKAVFEEGAFTSVPCGAVPDSAEAERRLHSWGLQMDLLEVMEMGESLFFFLTHQIQRPLSGIGSPLSGFFHPEEGSTLHLFSSEAVDVQGGNEDLPTLSMRTVYYI